MDEIAEARDRNKLPGSETFKARRFLRCRFAVIAAEERGETARIGDVLDLRDFLVWRESKKHASVLCTQNDTQVIVIRQCLVTKTKQLLTGIVLSTLVVRFNSCVSALD